MGCKKIYQKVSLAKNKNGGNFLSGLATGAVSSLSSSAIDKLHYSDGVKNALMIASGGISGGFASTIAGGDFWSGLRQGLIVAGFNHIQHKFVKPVFEHGDDPPVKKVKNSIDAVEHYFEGNGESVELGWGIKKDLWKSEENKRVIRKLTKGTAKKLTYNFSVDLTNSGLSSFHVGRTRVDYSTSCTKNICKTVFKAFVNDGFRDPLDIGQTIEKIFNIKNINIEIPRGTPYSYKPWFYSIKYKNPGYKSGINIK